MVKPRPKPWSLPAISDIAKSDCSPNGGIMISKAFEDLRSNYVVPLLDHLLSKILEGSTYTQKNAALDLAGMQVVVAQLTRELDGWAGTFIRGGKPRAGEDDEAEPDEIESLSLEDIQKVSRYMNEKGKQ